MSIQMKSVAVLLLALAAQAAQAHVTLAQKSAPASSYYKAVFQVGHGCDGSATTGITVVLPEGVNNAKPMPKAGWTLKIDTAKLDKPILNHGKPQAERVASITWQGGPLADAWYDEFTLQLRVPEQPGKLYFKVMQQCENGSVAWDDLPAAGHEGHELAHPAAMLEVTPAEMGEGHHH